MKKVIVFTISSFILIVLILGFFFRSQKTTSNPQILPTPTPVGGPSVQFNKIDYHAVFPDPTIAQSVEKTLQNPIGSTQAADMTIVSYPTDVSGRPNMVYEKNNVAQYVLQERTTDNADLNTFVTAHPNSQSFTLYDFLTAGVGFYWYVFPQDGMAFLANKDFGYAMRILYFPPTSQSSFTQTIGKQLNLQTTDPENAPDAQVQ